MNTNKEDMRELAAQLYAVVVSTMTGNELQKAVQNLVKITKDNHVMPLCCYTAVRSFIYFYSCENLPCINVYLLCQITEP